MVGHPDCCCIPHQQSPSLCLRTAWHPGLLLAVQSPDELVAQKNL